MDGKTESKTDKIKNTGDTILSGLSNLNYPEDQSRQRAAGYVKETSMLLPAALIYREIKVTDF